MLKLSVFIGLFFVATTAWAIDFDVNGKWETAFNYSEECSHDRTSDSYADCGTVENEGIDWYWGNGNGEPSSHSHVARTRVLEDAKYPYGNAGMGARFWKYDGGSTTNLLSAPASMFFGGRTGLDGVEKHPELWIRWYMRYQEGFRWNSINHNKLLYIWADRATGHVAAIPSLLGTSFVISPQGTSYSGQLSLNNAGWIHTYGQDGGTASTPSNGEWYCFEVQIKMDTTNSPWNGEARLWVDGVLRGETTNADFSNNDSTFRQGWGSIHFHHNQAYPGNEVGPLEVPYGYVDYSDIVIYTQTPPNRDADNKPFIGPLGWSGTPTPISAPSGFRAGGGFTWQ